MPLALARAPSGRAIPFARLRVASGPRKQFSLDITRMPDVETQREPCRNDLAIASAVKAAASLTVASIELAQWKQTKKAAYKVHNKAMYELQAAQQNEEWTDASKKHCTQAVAKAFCKYEKAERLARATKQNAKHIPLPVSGGTWFRAFSPGPKRPKPSQAPGCQTHQAVKKRRRSRRLGP